MEGEWSCYRGGQFHGGRKVMLGGQFNGGRMVMLQRCSVQWRENGYVTEVVINGGRMVMLQRWSV